jgi:hypothetical protein
LAGGLGPERFPADEFLKTESQSAHWAVTHTPSPSRRAVTAPRGIPNSLVRCSADTRTAFPPLSVGLVGAHSHSNAMVERSSQQPKPVSSWVPNRRTSIRRKRSRIACDRSFPGVPRGGRAFPPGSMGICVPRGPAVPSGSAYDRRQRRAEGIRHGALTATRRWCSCEMQPEDGDGRRRGHRFRRGRPEAEDSNSWQANADDREAGRAGGVHFKLTGVKVRCFGTPAGGWRCRPREGEEDFGMDGSCTM